MTGAEQSHGADQREFSPNDGIIADQWVAAPKRSIDIRLLVSKTKTWQENANDRIADPAVFLKKFSAARDV
jgi:hypothetical protein